jgi:hypothetical protein
MTKEQVNNLLILSYPTDIKYWKLAICSNRRSAIQIIVLQVDDFFLEKNIFIYCKYL